MAYINGLETMFGARIGSGLTADEILEMVYPVGSVYISASATSPASFMGGTWEQLKDRFLVGAGSTYANGATGGEATHTLTVNEMPSHGHEIAFDDSESSPIGKASGTANGVYPSGGWVSGRAWTLNAKSSGGSQPHNNMPPYLAVNMWKRIA